MHRRLLGLAQQPGDLGVDRRLGRLGERPAGQPRSAAAEEDRAAFWVADRAERRDSPNSRTILVARSVADARSFAAPGGALAELDQLRRPAAEPHRERLVQVILAVQVALEQRQLLSHAERLAGRQDGDLRDRVGVIRQSCHQGVPGLVDRHRVLLLRQQDVRPFPAPEQDPVPGVVEVGRRQHVAALADREDRCLVGEVGQIRAGEARRPAGHDVEVDIRPELLVPAVHGQDRGALVERRQRDDDLPVEPAGAQQRGVEHLRPVGGAEHHDAGGRRRSRPSPPAAG